MAGILTSSRGTSRQIWTAYWIGPARFAMPERNGKAGMEKLKSLILSHEDWLIDRVVHHAHQHDQTRFTSTLREAWRTSIAGLSQPLVASIDEALDNHVKNNKSLATAVAFGREQARKHR